MLVTGREAARLLWHVVSSDEQARLLLRTGIAGEGTRTSTGVMFEESAVRALGMRPRVDPRDLVPRCPQGLYIARLPRTTPLDLTRPWEEVGQLVTATIRQQRPMPALTAALVGVRIQVWGSLPLAATFLGFVVLVGDVTRLDRDGLHVDPPGPWADVVRDRWLPTSKGGRPWFLWTPDSARLDLH